MPAGFYCTVVRDTRSARKVAWLLGPYADHETALARVDDARRLAEAVDPFTAFDAFGTARLERDGELPPGVLNSQLEN